MIKTENLENRIRHLRTMMWIIAFAMTARLWEPGVYGWSEVE